MRARDAEVANLIAIDDPCAGCVLAEGHSASPDFVAPSVSADEDGSIRTVLSVSSHNGHLEQTELDLPGVLRSEQIVNHLNTPVAGKTVACNALCALILERRGNN